MKLKFSIRDSDFGLKAISDQFKQQKKDYAAVGVFGSRAAEVDADGATNLDKAFYNEYGTENIPARPFIRQTFEKSQGKLRSLANTLLGKIAVGEITKKQALDIMGDRFASMIRQAIENSEFEPNAPGTIAKKGSDKPLVDTGAMQRSISHEVR